MIKVNINGVDDISIKINAKNKEDYNTALACLQLDTEYKMYVIDKKRVVYSALDLFSFIALCYNKEIEEHIITECIELPQMLSEDSKDELKEAFNLFTSTRINVGKIDNPIYERLTLKP